MSLYLSTQSPLAVYTLLPSVGWVKNFNRPPSYIYVYIYSFPILNFSYSIVRGAYIHMSEMTLPPPPSLSLFIYIYIYILFILWIYIYIYIYIYYIMNIKSITGYIYIYIYIYPVMDLILGQTRLASLDRMTSQEGKDSVLCYNYIFYNRLSIKMLSLFF